MLNSTFSETNKHGDSTLRVLLDCGAYTGDSVPTLLKGYGQFDRVVCFEANPNLDVVADGVPLEIVRAAVWTEDSELTFFFGEQDTQSSVMENKTTGGFSKGRSTRVQSVDIAEWIVKNLDEDDRVTLKLDIEGAEFDVLERLLKHPRAFKKLEYVLVEWHNNRLRPRWRYLMRRRLSELRFWLRGRPIQLWSKRVVARIRAGDFTPASR